MKIFRRVFCLVLALSVLLSTGILEALALSQDTMQPEVETTGELVDLSDMFVVEETQPEQTEKTMSESEILEPVTFVQTKAAVTGEAEGFSYTVLEDGTCSVTGYTGGMTENLEIPEMLDGYTVSAIGNNAFKGSAFVSIHLPDSVTTIGNGAFQNCAALKSINYPLQLQSVGSGVWSGIFSGCTALESIVVPEGVTALPDNVFFYAESLKSVTLPSTLVTVGQHAFDHSGITAIDLPDGVTSIGNYAFNECVALETAELGNSLTSVGAFAFAECGALTALTLPDTVESIGNSAFKNCASVTSFTYPKNLKSVATGYISGVFSGCASLEAIEIPEGVTALPENVFYYSESLQSVKLPSTLVTIGKNAFDHSGITAVDLPDGVTSIGNYAFQDCAALESAELGSSLTYIGAYAFDGCAALTSLVLPNTVETMEYGAFRNCVKLASVTYPANLKKTTSNLWTGVFTGCTALESMEIPEGVTAIPDNVFFYAESLKSVKLPSTLTSIGNHAFDHTALTSVDLPNGMTVVGDYAFNSCTALASVKLGSSLTSIGAFAFAECKSLTALELPNTVATIGNSAFKNCENLASFTYPKSLTEVTAGYQSGIFSGCKALESIVVPEGVTMLPANVFYYADSLKSVTIPSTVTSVGASAFHGCGELTEIILPDAVETIGADAFVNCKKLVKFGYPASLKQVDKSLWTGIFTGCTALESIEVPEGITTLPSNLFYYAKSLKSVNLPSTLTAIGDSAFYATTFTAINLPDGVISVGNSAFQDCVNLEAADLGANLKSLGGNAFSGCTALTEVDLPETVETIGYNAFMDCTSLQKVELSAALTSLGFSAFQGCTALESIVLGDELTNLQSNVFYGCTALRTVHLPRKLKQIQGYVFGDCVSLKEIYIPNSVTNIANSAFDGVPGITFRCDLLSYAAEYALDRKIPIIPTKINNELTSTLLNSENSYYIHNYDGLSASGVMSMVVRYELRENAGVTPKAITVHVYDFAALRENTITLDGKQCTNYTYDQETGRLTIPVEAASGTIRFCLKPKRYEALTSYARLIYTDSTGKEDMELVGSVNSLMPALNITARERTAATSVHVSGLAVPETEVSLYLDGAFVKKVKTNKIGDYSADVSLGVPVEGREYIIAAEAADRNGNLAKAEAKVTYSYQAPDLRDFVMFYDSHKANRISLMDMQDLKPVLSFNPQLPFRFEMDFVNPEILNDVYVVSTRNNVKKYMKAYWDEDLGVFVAEGYFDPMNHIYVPGVLSVEYVCGGERLSFSQEVDFGSQEAYDALPQHWKDAQYDVLENTESSTVVKVTVGSGEDQLSFRMSSFTQPIPEGLTEENIEEYGFIKLTDDYGKNLYIQGDSQQTATFAADDADSGSQTKVTIADFAKDQTTDFVIDQAVNLAGEVFEIGTEVSSGMSMFDVLGDTIGYFETKHLYDAMEEAYWADDSKTASEKKHFSEQKETADKVNLVTTIVSVVYTGVSGVVTVVYPPAGAVLLVTGVLGGILIDGIRVYVENDMWETMGDIEVNIKWVIDPSGYVYDEVTGKRLEGVTVRAYWVEKTEEDEAFWDDKPGSDEYGVLWDSLEYSQLNPLVTDAEGRYAWDVPEGWWRVSYEKEGYESTWSQWLPVPPPQTEVNIGMKPLAAEHTHTVVTIPGKAATCTRTGLTEGKKCSECGEILVAQKKTAVLAHKYDNKVDGTCNSCGVHRENVETRKVVHMFRMYNPNTGEHFYTGSTVERDNLTAVGWQYEGVGFTFPANTGAPVYRLFHEPTGEHLYTMSKEEKEMLEAKGWNYEGIAFNSAYDTEAVQHRLHNPNATVGAYHFTFSTEERDTLISLGWEYQGIGWYSCWK